MAQRMLLGDSESKDAPIPGVPGADMPTVDAFILDGFTREALEEEARLREQLLQSEAAEQVIMQSLWKDVLKRDGGACIRCGTSVTANLHPFPLPEIPHRYRREARAWVVLCTQCEVQVTALKLQTKWEILNSCGASWVCYREEELPAWHLIVYGAGRKK